MAALKLKAMFTLDVIYSGHSWGRQKVKGAENGHYKKCLN